MVRPSQKAEKLPADQSGENVKGSAALAGGVDDLFAVTGAGACEYLRKFGNQGAGDGPATNDGREGHPERHAAYVRADRREEHSSRQKVTMMDTMEVIQTKLVRGCSKLNSFFSANSDLLTASFTK